MDYFFDNLDFFYENKKFFEQNILTPESVSFDYNNVPFFERNPNNTQGSNMVYEKELFQNNSEGNMLFSPYSDLDDPLFPSHSFSGVYGFSDKNFFDRAYKNDLNASFNSINEVSSVENIENLSKNSVINIDARSYNSISSNMDLEDISNYIADKLYEAVSSSSEVVHSV